MEGSENSRLAVDILNANVPPLTKNCVSDGVVIYDGNGIHGTQYGEIINEFKMFHVKNKVFYYYMKFLFHTKVSIYLNVKQ